MSQQLSATVVISYACASLYKNSHNQPHLVEVRKSRARSIDHGLIVVSSEVCNHMLATSHMLLFCLNVMDQVDCI